MVVLVEAYVRMLYEHRKRKKQILKKLFSLLQMNYLVAQIVHLQ